MSDLVTAKFHNNEISKAVDFNYAAESALVAINALMDGAFGDVEQSFVFSGLSVVAAVPPGMTVVVQPGLAYSRVENKALHLGSDVSVSVTAAHSTLSRIDTIEARAAVVDIDNETRGFKDSSTGVVTYADIPTKTKSTIEFRCNPGIAGSGVAPALTAGWMKIAEIIVAAAATQIIAGSIKGLTAPKDGDANSAWTIDQTATFYLGSIDYIKSTLLTHIANNITSINTVHGIRQGSTFGFDADLLDGKHGSAAATANTHITRDAAGRAKVVAPAAADDIARLDTVTTHAGLAAAGTHGSATAATANTLVHRDAAGRAKVVAPAAADDIARLDTVENQTVAPHAIVRLTSGSGNWTVPAGVTRIKVTCVGGGGGGAGGRVGAPGGGGGGTIISNVIADIIAVTPGASLAYSVGPGGAGGATGTNNGSPGTASTFAGASSNGFGSGGGFNGSGGLGSVGNAGSAGGGAGVGGGAGGGAGGRGGMVGPGAVGEFGGGGGGGPAAAYAGNTGGSGIIIIEY